MISAVVPSYNSWRTVERTADSLLAQPASAVSEIIVVDSSDDGKTFALLEKRRSDRFRLLRLEQKTMPAVGRNLGAAEAKGEILAFLDADAYAEKDWGEAILRACKEGYRAGGGAILLPPEQRRSPLALAQYFLQFNEFMGGRKRPVRFAPSCNLFCRRDFFNEIGGFPEIRAAEDVLFGLEASSRSPFVFDPRVRVYHIFLEETERYLSNQKLLGEYIMIYRRKRSRSALLRGPWPALFLPGILAAKSARIAWRVHRTGGVSSALAFWKNFPLFLSGMRAWGRGFLQGAREEVS